MENVEAYEGRFEVQGNDRFRYNDRRGVIDHRHEWLPEPMKGMFGLYTSRPICI